MFFFRLRCRVHARAVQVRERCYRAAQEGHRARAGGGRRARLWRELGAVDGRARHPQAAPAPVVQDRQPVGRLPRWCGCCSHAACAPPLCVECCHLFACLSHVVLHCRRRRILVHSLSIRPPHLSLAPSSHPITTCCVHRPVNVFYIAVCTSGIISSPSRLNSVYVRVCRTVLQSYITSDTNILLSVVNELQLCWPYGTFTKSCECSCSL